MALFGAIITHKGVNAKRQHKGLTRLGIVSALAMGAIAMVGAPATAVTPRVVGGSILR